MRAEDPGQVSQVVRLHDGPPILLRLPVTDSVWAETLPPVPDGLRVTAAFSDPEVEAEHGEAVSLLGYLSVGALVNLDAPETVDLLIPRDALDRWPLWRDQLLAAGGRVYDTGFGPVAMLMGRVLAIHAR